MGIKINIGVTKKIGTPNYGSRGASCNAEFELDGSFDNGGAQRFQESAQRAYQACQAAVDAELAKPDANSNSIEQTSAVPKSTTMADQNSEARHQNGNRESRGTNGDRRATASQVRAIHAISSRQRINLQELLPTSYQVNRPEDLSIRDASELIDMLKRPVNVSADEPWKGSQYESTSAVERPIDANCHERPERDFISWSQLSTFRQCPLKYHFRYDLRLPEEFTTSSLLFGSGIHRAVEVLHRDQLEGNPRRSLDNLVEEFWAEWKYRAEDVADVRFGAKEDVQSIGELANRVLTSFLQSELSRPDGAVIAIEEELRGQILLGAKDLLAVVDLVIADDDSLILRDYKTSRSRWSKNHAEEAADQLLLYSELVGRLALAERSMRLEFVVLTKASSPAIELYELDIAPQRLAKTKLIAGRTTAAIAAGNIYPNHSPTNCSGCPYQSACRKWCR